MEARLRFAPSPTGFLHLGSLRTALFGYIIAKKLSGKFILRIEDTDQKREVEGAVEKLIDILDWVGIKFDEGPHVGGQFGAYVQSQRMKIYKEYIDILLKRGRAYHCFCTAERLMQMREKQQAEKKPPRYDRVCREFSEEEVEKRIKSGEPFVIRQKMPLAGEIVAHDELRGDINFQVTNLEDHILIKSNGAPTYQFANVIDDYLMKITHVTRSEEWIPSFPKNILLYQSFGWKLPKFIHFPVVLNKGGGKLSKRQGDVAVEDYKEKGYLPEALVNFCALMGWHPKDDNEILNLSQIINIFEIKDMSVSGAIFDIEKLNYLNGYYIRNKPIIELSKLSLEFFEKFYREKESISILENFRKKDFIYINKVMELEQPRLKKLSDIGEATEFFFNDNIIYDSNLLIWKNTTKGEIKENLESLFTIIENISAEAWDKIYLENIIIEYIKNNNKKVGNFLWPMRVALTGRAASPGPFEVAGVLGKKETLLKIKKAINKMTK